MQQLLERSFTAAEVVGLGLETGTFVGVLGYFEAVIGFIG
jgi:hypothetical protein